MVTEGGGSDSAALQKPPPRPRDGRRAEVIAIVEAVLLALVTLLAAWAGYSGAHWSTDSGLDLARGSALRSEANRAQVIADTMRDFDASAFNTWFIAYTLGNRQKMAVAERRFRPVFRVAFKAWRAADRAHDPSAPPGPTYMPQYHQPQLTRASILSQRASAASADGARTGQISDNYFRISVVLASVLFLVGIGRTFTIRTVRWVLAGIGGLLFAAALALIFAQPIP